MPRYFENYFRKHHFSFQIGNYVEEAIGNRLANSALNVPLLDGEPKLGKWFRIDLPEGRSGDGSHFHMYIKRGTSDKLCIFLSGGGIAWNEFTAARPVTGGKVLSRQPNYYWENLRPFTQIMNIEAGITLTNDYLNPFNDWNFIVIPYSTGDMHLGSCEFPYIGEDGEEHILYHHGYANFHAAMDMGKQFFPEAAQILLAGESAGAFAVPALADEIIDDYYPECNDITMFSDSAQLLFLHWRHILHSVWRAPDRVWEASRTGNITLDWYFSLCEKNKKRSAERPERHFKYLYAGSPHDYLLSAFFSDMNYKEYRTGQDLQHEYFMQMRSMISALKRIDPDFGIYIYNWPHPAAAGGGSAHTSVRQPSFFLRGGASLSLAEWLYESICGIRRPSDVGIHLLKI